jgi:hypothetical protein
MSNEVYANGNSVSCKAGDAKVIAAFPDVCLSPPSPPAGPVPVPYPDTSFSKDMQNGSKTVMIGGQEVMLKDQSFYKTSPLGNEAATNSLGANVITHVITGKTYFVSWSMDVLFEGANVDRNIDITTSNHASPPAGEAALGPNIEKYSPSSFEAQVPGKHKCECCGQQAHTQDQANGNSMSEEEWYDTENNPANRALLEKVRNHPKCKHLLPKKGSKCSKYYVTKPRNPNEQAAIETAWSQNAAAYRTFAGVPPGSPISHRVPKAAGGCPYGQGNLAPTGKKCQKLENALGRAQEARIRVLRAARG